MTVGAVEDGGKILNDTTVAFAGEKSAGIKSPSRFYRPELDVLRFIAFFLVFLRHAPPDFLSGRFTVLAGMGGAGLQLFFLLSAFLITELLLRERERTGTIHLKSFFTRRILRIWPLYLSFVAGSFVAATWLKFGTIPRSAVLAYLLMVGNWWIVTHSFNLDWIMHLWSISIEEQFYLLWPVLCKSTLKIRTVLWVAVALMCFISLVNLIVLGKMHAVQHEVWCNSFVEFLYFACGVGLALVLHGQQYTPRLATRICWVGIALGSLYLAASHCDLMNHGAVPAAALIEGYLLIALSVVSGFLGIYCAKMHWIMRPFIFLGKISYGLYVFHLLGIHIGGKVGKVLHLPAIVAGLIAIGVSILLAALSYYSFERRFLELKKRFTFVSSRPN